MLKILILNNYKTLLKFILWASIIYAIAYYVSENNGMSNEEKIKIDSLNNVILKIQKDQLRLDSTIIEFNKEIDKIDNSINKIKSLHTLFDRNCFLAEQKVWIQEVKKRM